MKNKIFRHPLGEIASTPRGYGKDEYMMTFIQHAILRLGAVEADWTNSDFCRLFYFESLKHSLEWLRDYYQGAYFSDEEYNICSYYAWVFLQKIDEDLEFDA